MLDLTPRRQAVLGLVIRSYVEKGQPVSSKAFVQGYGLEISAATIRNEMAVLEEMGYLTHPHTSAGRVPTEVGYRYFVEHLLGETELPLAEQHMIRHQFHQAQLELDQWVRLAVAVLAHTTRKAALATPPRARASKFKHLELISLRDTLVLLVFVLQGGTVKQQVVSLDQPMDQESLSRLSNQLNEQCKGLTGSQIRACLAAKPSFAGQVGQFIGAAMEGIDGHESGALYRDGLAHILAEPEFAEGGSMRQMVQTLEGASLAEIVATSAGPLEVGGVQVLIGGEGRWREFGELSLILSRYGVEGGASGLLGVVGPVRMSYNHTIGAVRYVARLMSDRVSDWYDVAGGAGELFAD